MHKYTNGQNVRCSFCGLRGHNVRSCSEVNLAAADDDNLNYDSYHVIKAKEELKKRETRQKSRTVPRKKPQCGFCRSSNHNRKNCKRMRKFKSKIYKANSNWRAWFAERVNILGVGQGALIEATGVPVNVFTRVNIPKTRAKHVGIVNEYDHNNLNVFCNFTGSYDYRSNADVTVKLITTGGLIDISIGKYIGEDLFHKNAFFAHYSKVKVVTPKSIEFTEDWVVEKSIPILDWLPQTHSYEELESLGIVRFIEEWTKNVLDNNDE